MERIDVRQKCKGETGMERMKREGEDGKEEGDKAVRDKWVHNPLSINYYMYIYFFILNSFVIMHSFPRFALPLPSIFAWQLSVDMRNSYLAMKTPINAFPLVEWGHLQEIILPVLCMILVAQHVPKRNSEKKLVSFSISPLFSFSFYFFLPVSLCKKKKYRFLILENGSYKHFAVLLRHSPYEKLSEVSEYLFETPDTDPFPSLFTCCTRYNFFPIFLQQYSTSIFS